MWDSTILRSRLLTSALRRWFQREKIFEVLAQDELLGVMRNISDDLEKQKQGREGVGVMDSGVAPTQKTEQGYEIPVPTKQEFFDALTKASGKVHQISVL